MALRKSATKIVPASEAPVLEQDDQVDNLDSTEEPIDLDTEDRGASADLVRAYLNGWRDYLENDPTPAHEALKKANSANTDDFMLFSRKMIIDEKLVTGRDPNGGRAQIGRLDPERFATQISQLEELGILPKGKVRAADAVITDFLPRPGSEVPPQVQESRRGL